MKKIVLLVLAVFLIGCSSDSTSENEAEVKFTGTIQAIDDKMAIVSIEEGEILNSGNEASVDLSTADERTFQVGDRVRVTYDGVIRETHPLSINTLAVERIESARDFDLRKLDQYMLQGDYVLIYNHTGPEFQEYISLESFSESADEIHEEVTGYTLVDDIDYDGGLILHWMSDGEDIGMGAFVSEDGIIEQLEVFDITSPRGTDLVHTENTYTLPMRGEWFVLWGGTNEIENYHYSLDIQRYAIDLVILDENNYAYDGDPDKNEDYYAFGEEVLAPLEGTVVIAKDGVPDNIPGVERNMEEALGNYVVIEHEHEEYSIISHFKENSIVVEEGDEVEAGEVLGQVGNSGNSGSPHIHYQVSDGKDFYESKSIRIEFEDGSDPTLGEWVTGF